MSCKVYSGWFLKRHRATAVNLTLNSTRWKINLVPGIFSPLNKSSHHTTSWNPSKHGSRDNAGRLRSCSGFHHYRSNDQHLMDKMVPLRDFLTSRGLATSAVDHRNPILPNNILRSPMPDLNLPTDLSIHQMVFEKCDQFKDRLAMEDFLTGRKYTYTQLKEAIVHVTSALYRRGYRKGDVLLAFSTNNIDYVVLMVACAAAGIWFSGANPSYTAAELARHLNNCGARGIVTLPELTGIAKEAVASKDFPTSVKDFIVFGEASGFEPFQNLLDDDGKAFPDVDIDPVKDVFALPYSSGTTGFPKGVMLSHHNIVANLFQYNAAAPTQFDDKCLGLLPLFHVFGKTVNLFPALMEGASVTYLDRFEPESFLKCLQNTRISLAHLVPPLILFLAKHPMVSNYDLTSLKQIVVGAAPLGQNLMAECRERHPSLKRFIQGYGLTETSPAITIDTTQTLGSVGPVVPNTLVKIVDPESQKVLGVGEPGEICTKGPQVMLGYYKNQEATDRMITSEGWMYTGDIGYFDENGLVYVQDRLKELIKYKGIQIAPAELEALLLSHPDIQDTAVVGVPDEAAGELPRAFVVVKPGASITEEQVANFVEGKVSPSKRLRGGVQFCKEIPKSPSGKILRRVIKSEYM